MRRALFFAMSVALVVACNSASSVQPPTAAPAAAATPAPPPRPLVAHALAMAGDGRALVAKADAAHTWVDAYAENTLRPLGSVMDKPGCGDRLVVNGWRGALLCMATGEIATGNLRGSLDMIEGRLPNV